MSVALTRHLLAPQSSMDQELSTAERRIASEPTPQQVLEYLDWLDRPATIDHLARRLSITRHHLKALLQRLEDRGEITVDAGLHHVYVRHSDDSAVADGSGRNQPPTMDAGLEIALADLLDVLANERRREAIRVLDDWTPAADSRRYVSVPELAHGIDTGSIETRDDQPTTAPVKPLYVALHNTHVPLLDRYDIVDYRNVGRASTLTPTPLLGDVARILEYLDTVTEADLES